MFPIWFKKTGNQLILVAIFTVASLYNCNSKEKPMIYADVDNCLQCGMIINQVNQGCGFISNNEFTTFCSPSCLLNKYQSMDKSNRPASSLIYFADYPTTDLLPADSVMFLLTNHITTVMNSGVLTFREPDEASSYKKHDDEILTYWRGFRIFRGKADKTIEIQLSVNGLLPDVVLVDKDELVEWKILLQDPGIHDSLQIKGFDEMSNIEILPDGDPVVVRMLADKPGEGFPIIRLSDNKILGMVKVMGAHTSDEEVM